jgi:hypothetical protein
MKVQPSLVTDSKFWIDMHGLYKRCSFILHKEGLKSDLHIGIEVTSCLLIVFIGLGRKSTVFIFCCCLVFLPHLILSPNCHIPAFIIFLAATLEIVDGGFTLYVIECLSGPVSQKLIMITK